MFLITARAEAEQIIVIAPYHAQVMKLRQLFRQDQKLRNISVGSVEEFQGQVLAFLPRLPSRFIKTEIFIYRKVALLS